MLTYLCVFTGWFLGSMVGAATALGSMIMALPFLLMVLSPVDSVVLSCIVGLLACGQLVWFYRKYIVWKDVLWLGVGCVPGCLIGAYGLTIIPMKALQFAVAGTVLLFVCVQLFAKKIPWRLPPEDNIGTAVAGFFAGFFNSTISVVGIPLAVFIILKRWEPNHARGVLSVLYIISGGITVLSHGAMGLMHAELLIPILVAIGASIIGNQIGFYLGKKIKRELFVKIVLIFLTVSAAILLYKAF